MEPVVHVKALASPAIWLLKQFKSLDLYSFVCLPYSIKILVTVAVAYALRTPHWSFRQRIKTTIMSHIKLTRRSVSLRCLLLEVCTVAFFYEQVGGILSPRIKYR